MVDRTGAAVADLIPVDHSVFEGGERSRSGLPPGPTLATSVGWWLGVVGFVVGARPIADNSFLTHLATGQVILEEGRVPTADPYSFVAAGEPWTVQSWLPSLVYAGLDATVGGWAIRVLHGLVGAAIVLGLWRLVAPARLVATRVGLVGVALLIGTALWAPRPLLFGVAFMVVTLQVVQGQLNRWWLVPVFWLWVSSHGSFVLGIGLIGAVTVGAAIDGRHLPRRELSVAVAAVVGCAAAALNPLGWRLLWFPFQMMLRSEALAHVMEWQAPTFRSPFDALFFLLLPLVVVAARRRAPWRSLLPTLAFMAAGLMAARNIGLAAVVAVSLLAPSLADLGGTLDGAVRNGAARLAAVAAVVGAGIVVVATSLASPLSLDDYPTEQVDWLDERGLVAQPDVRLLHRELVGNYLTLRFGDEARVAMDDRFDFYPQQVIDDHAALVYGGDVGEVIDRYDFNVALWATDSTVARWLEASDEWQVVQADEDWMVACRLSSPVADRCLMG